ncbi:MULTISPECIES: mechanosensitive ion channel domain-containing protein [Moorena]|uniref:Mechanosensitive ion channel n=2 Tax=Moorena TaxID=1155738 RepID=A0A1D9GA97_MOOP1|nr:MULTISPECIES: mechanosensitive ion channel domain-containing protein [Moorena]AOY84568.2 mechanosensitive ion channel [Moorena producens JHB]
MESLLNVRFSINPFPRARLRRCLGLVLLGVLTLLLTLLPASTLAQEFLANGKEKAPVVVDGIELFQVGNAGNFSATERAELINQRLAKEVKSLQKPEYVDIEYVGQNEGILRTKFTERIIVTITKADQIPDTDPLEQAEKWEKLIERAIRQGKQQRMPDYSRQAVRFTSIVLVLLILLYLLLRLFRQFALRKLTSWLGNPASPFFPWHDPAKLFLGAALLGLQVILWTTVILTISDLFPQVRSWRYELLNFLKSPVIGPGESKYSAIQVLLLVVLTVVLWFGVSALTRLFRHYILGKTGADSGVQDVIALLTQYVLTFLGMIIILQSSGLDLSSLTIFASVLGVGIGFGVQNIANNFISGLIITLERPIQQGDFIKVNDLVGTVQQIGSRSTEICTLDKVTIIVPNARFLETEVINWSHGNPISRLKIPVGVAYGSDVEQVKKALLAAAKSHPEVLLRPYPQVWFQEFGESSLKFELLVWTGDPKRQPKIKSDLNYRIEKSLRRYDIHIPFPQRDLHVRSPQLEKLLMAWLGERQPKPPENQLYIPNGYQSEPPTQDSLVSGFLEPMDEVDLDSYPTAPLQEDMVTLDIETLVEEMRQPGGLEIKDRRYRLNSYGCCFVGSEAVDWLVKRCNSTREDAVTVGQILINRGIIHHVADDHPFRDDYLFYRFYLDEN